MLNEHREVWEAIPWVVAGTANFDQVRMVEDHVGNCSSCDSELAWQQKIHLGMQDIPSGPDTAALNAGLARLWECEREAGRARLPDAPGGAGDTEAHAVSVSFIVGRSKNKRWLLMALTVQAMATLVLGMQFASSKKPDDTGPDPPPELPEPILRLVPHGQTDMNALRRLLNQHGLRIVGADEDANSLLLAPLRSEPIPVPSAVALLETLRDEPGVMMVMPVVPKATR
ncbi:hypothetical protein ACFX58_14620 [Sphingomonas sp. NCPPB 2930]